jgi:tRNA G18 (ribose-2'-O)-methylase SpoU
MESLNVSNAAAIALYECRRGQVAADATAIPP